MPRLVSLVYVIRIMIIYLAFCSLEPPPNPCNILEIPDKPPLPVICSINPCADFNNGSISFILFINSFCWFINDFVWSVNPRTPSSPIIFSILSYACSKVDA